MNPIFLEILVLPTLLFLILRKLFVFVIVNSVFPKEGVKRLTQIIVLVLVQIYYFFIREVTVHWHIICVFAM